MSAYELHKVVYLPGKWKWDLLTNKCGSNDEQEALVLELERYLERHLPLPLTPQVQGPFQFQHQD